MPHSHHHTNNHTSHESDEPATGDPALRVWLDELRHLHRPEEEGLDAVLLDM